MTIGDIDLGVAGIVAAGVIITGLLLGCLLWWKGKAP